MRSFDLAAVADGDKAVPVSQLYDTTVLLSGLEMLQRVRRS